MKQHVYILQGAPGSGKTTWAKAKCEQDITYIRISRDDLRRMRGKYWIPTQEDLITELEVSCVKSSLSKGYNVIIDATHLSKKYINAWIKLLREFDVDITVKPFNVSLETALIQDVKREFSVGQDVIIDKFKRYITGKPLFEEYTIQSDYFKVQPVVQDDLLVHAIVVDLDGTLCLHNGRDPFDYQKCDADLPNYSVIKIVQDYIRESIESHKKSEVIYLSGREDVVKDKSITWLSKYVWAFDNKYISQSLFMRKAGDMRDDRIVKNELFNDNIKDKYYVEFVLDDRDKVVQMWRDMGLTCLQVANGNF